MVNHKIITRVTHAKIDLLTSFDLRGHNFRADVEFDTYYHGHTQSNIFRDKKLLPDIFFNQNSNSFSEFYQKFRFLFESWVAVFVTELFTTVYYCLRTCFWHLFRRILNWKIPDTNTVGTGELSTLENINLWEPNSVDISSAMNSQSEEGARDVDNIWDSAITLLIQSLFFSQRQVISENKPFYIFVLLHSAQYCNKIIIQHFHSNC